MHRNMMKYLQDFQTFREVRRVSKNFWTPWSDFSANHATDKLLVYENGHEWLERAISQLTWDMDFLYRGTAENTALCESKIKLLEEVRRRSEHEEDVAVAVVYVDGYTSRLESYSGRLCWFGSCSDMPFLGSPLKAIVVFSTAVVQNDLAAARLTNIVNHCNVVDGLTSSEGMMDVSLQDQKEIIESSDQLTIDVREELIAAFRKHRKTIREFVDLCVPRHFAQLLTDVDDIGLTPKSIRYDSWDGMCRYDNVEDFCENVIFLQNLEVCDVLDKDDLEPGDEDYLVSAIVWMSMAKHFEHLLVFDMPMSSDTYYLKEFIGARRASLSQLLMFGINRANTNCDDYILQTLVDSFISMRQPRGRSLCLVLVVTYEQWTNYLLYASDSTFAVRRLQCVVDHVLIVVNCPTNKTTVHSSTGDNKNVLLIVQSDCSSHFCNHIQGIGSGGDFHQWFHELLVE